MRTHLLRSGRPLPHAVATPTGHDLVHDVLAPLTRLPALDGRIAFGTRVVAVAREGLLKHEHIDGSTRAAAPFRLLVDGPDGERSAHADLVLDCTGTYANPHPLGDGKSAQTAARDLAGLTGTRVERTVRAEEPDRGELPDDTLPGRQQLVGSSRALARGENKRVHLRTGTRVSALHPEGSRIRAHLTEVQGAGKLLCDHVVALTGYSADASLHRQLQIHECYATGAPMNLSATLLAAAGGDCLAQPPAGLDALTNPEPDCYIVGAKSYGRLNTFLLRTGYEQVGEVLSAHTAQAHRAPTAMTDR